MAGTERQHDPSVSAVTTMALPVLVFFAAALQFTDNQVLPLLVPGLSEKTWPGSDAHWLLAVYPLGAAAGPLLSAGIFPRFQGRPAIVTGLLLLSLSEVLFATTPSFTSALVLRALAGAASGLLSYTLLIEAVAHGNRAVTMMTSGLLLAYVAGIPSGAKLEAWLGLEVLYLSLAGCGAMLAISALFVIRKRDLNPATPESAIPPKPFTAFFRERHYVQGLVTSLVIGAALAGPIALFPTVLQSDTGAGLSQNAIGNLYYIAGLGPILALPFAPRLIRRAGRRRTAISGALILILPLLLIPVAAKAPWSAATLLLIALLVETVRRSALQGHLATLAPMRDRARFLSLRNVCVQTSISGGIVVGKTLTDAGGFHLACVAAAMLCLVAAATVPHNRFAGS